MPTASSSDATSVEAAYQDKVKALFAGLCTNLEQGGGDQQSVQRFTKGYNLAKRAKELALNVVAGTSGEAAAMRIVARKARSRSNSVDAGKQRRKPR
jgi:hypothetical protein